MFIIFPVKNCLSEVSIFSFIFNARKLKKILNGTVTAISRPPFFSNYKILYLFKNYDTVS
jgi:hypothetical protein